jgi:hypothetical protein
MVGQRDNSAVSVKSVRRGPWEEVRDPSVGSVYYYNHDTGVSQWDTPEEYSSLHRAKVQGTVVEAVVAFAGM